jgi:hypothetical protein
LKGAIIKAIDEVSGRRKKNTVKGLTDPDPKHGSTNSRGKEIMFAFSTDQGKMTGVNTRG